MLYNNNGVLGSQVSGSGATGPTGPAGGGTTGATGPAGTAGPTGPAGGGDGLPSRTTGAITTSSLSSATSATGPITGYKGYALYSIQTSAAAWVTVYSSNAALTADAGRSITTDPTPGSGVLAEVITSGDTIQYFSPAIMGYSSESPPTTAIPVKVYNNGNSSVAITATLTFVQTEA